MANKGEDSNTTPTDDISLNEVKKNIYGLFLSK